MFKLILRHLAIHFIPAYRGYSKYRFISYLIRKFY